MQSYTNTTEGSVVVFQCELGFVPEGEMTAVCGSDGQWDPNPGGVTCTPRPTLAHTQPSTPTQTSTPTGPGQSQLTIPCTITLRINLSCFYNRAYLESFTP